MKQLRRQQKDIDKTRGRLFDWATRSNVGAYGIERTIAALAAEVARCSGHSSPDVTAALAREPFVELTRILALLIWLTGDDSAKRSETPLARYSRERARRESSTGRRWLQQLSESRFELRKVIDVTPDTSLRLGAPPGAGAPVTVHEPRLANPRLLGLVLFGRVLPMPAGSVLADGMLMLEPHIVARLPPSPRISDVFSVWATEALVAEGYLSVKPQHPPAQSPGARPSFGNTDDTPSNRSAGPSQAPSHQEPQDAEAREKLLARVRKLFAMAQATEASPHEAEIALRRCQSLMTKFGITEKDLETSEFGRQTAYTGKRVPMHIQFLSMAVANLHGVIFVTGGGAPAHFRGYDIDVRVARLTLDYLSDAVERALTARRRSGDFPPGRVASYDYRLAFADEVSDRVDLIVREREAQERANSPTGTALTIRKLEIVERECGQDLYTNTVRARGAIDHAAAGAGREDGSRVSLDPQVGRGGTKPLLGSD
ncbi:DUF2786 domain-containing protein [Granulosicoccus antarcticus]|uniref:Uncharacterized protein n=1 Tax=Granulosicoccus antarcticus IMCC3135 TaxID=1192854 RepID=A0A2Z2NJH8_9GAMM|nr:DUF2786 domain-containing protein [Granulosicoccus antarcticus]ASJ70655.1 hypothetical protein IMCC3135_02710 [Granulosicoccus antarcticus IMCC3135]